MKQRIPDRFERQKTLMPYLHLLPEPLRGRNERIDDRFPVAAAPEKETEESRFAWESE